MDDPNTYDHLEDSDDTGEFPDNQNPDADENIDVQNYKGIYFNDEPGSKF